MFARIDKGLSVVEVAKSTGLNRATIRKIEKTGRGEERNFRKIGEVVGVTIPPFDPSELAEADREGGGAPLISTTAPIPDVLREFATAIENLSPPDQRRMVRTVLLLVAAIGSHQDVATAE